MPYEEVWNHELFEGVNRDRIGWIYILEENLRSDLKGRAFEELILVIIMKEPYLYSFFST